MVGGLVHQQHVGVAEQHARHGDAHLPPARERADVAVDPIVLEAEPVQHFAGLALERVAPEMVVLLLHFAEAREDLVHVVDARRIGHRVLQLLELVMEIADASAAGNGFVQHRPARHLLDVLAEVADGQLLRHGDFAVIRTFFAGDHAEDGGLAGAVGSDEADFFTRVELKRRVHEKDLLAVLLVDVRERDHVNL